MADVGYDGLTEAELEAKLTGLEAASRDTRAKLGALKAGGAPKEEVQAAEAELTGVLARLEQVRQRVEIPRRLDINRASFEQLMKRRFFFTPSFSIYGGVAGLYDIGPPGCATKANMISLWRKHFIIAEGMFELDTTAVTPMAILKASGHVAKFSDLMVQDTVNEKCYRADHLVEDKVEALLAEKGISEERRAELLEIERKIDDLDAKEITVVIRELGITAPETGNALSDAYPFNLMFETKIGPTGKHVGFMRPETAQSIFMNFGRLLEANGGNIPFAGACVGQAFRNEISPRAGLLRVLEFTLCEIEHFVDPNDKSHPKFVDVRDVEVHLYSRERQEKGHDRLWKTTIGEALDKGVVGNETMAYFIARTAQFARLIGLKEGKFRFRQHKSKEMAHYACDCWDLEALTSYGWIECVGIADRACYDLSVHAEASGASLDVFREFPEPRITEKFEAVPDKGAVGKAFRKEAGVVTKFLSSLSEQQTKSLQAALEATGESIVTVEGKEYKLTKDMLSFKAVKTKQTGERITPGVIEPSFGVGRLLYAVWEQAFYIRDGDEQRNVLSLSPMMAPSTTSILPLMIKPELTSVAREVSKSISSAGVSCSQDFSAASIGRRYARADEVGTTFAVTVDYDTLRDNTVTLRERDSMRQVRVPTADLVELLRGLTDGRVDWAFVLGKYPEHFAAEK